MMTKLVKWLGAILRRSKPEVDPLNFTGITAMLDMLKKEEGITPGHP